MPKVGFLCVYPLVLTAGDLQLNQAQGGSNEEDRMRKQDPTETRNNKHHKKMNTEESRQQLITCSNSGDWKLNRKSSAA